VKTLTRHEKKLTLMLAGAVGLGLHLILLKFALEFDRANRRQCAVVEEELTEARFWMEQRGDWQARTDWLEKSFRPVPSENPAPALQKMLQSTAAAAGLKVEEQKPPVPKTQARFVQYANRMRMSGSLSQFLEWLVAVYRPEEGIAVTSLNLKIGPEPPKMVGEVVVGQYFRPNNP